MDWNEYKALCDSPPVFSRWMLEQSVELLVDEPRLAHALGRLLETSPIEKPSDHRGGAATDMFVVSLSARDARAIVASIGTAIDDGRTTTATRARGLGGFREAWREYAAYVERMNFANQEGDVNDATTVVKSLIAAFNASDLPKVMTHFAADAVYHNIPVAPVSGTQAICGVVESFMGMATQVDWQMLNIAQSGANVVLTERVDRFLIKGKWIGLPVMGTFEVSGGKISAWRDYFDMNQFQSQLPR
jgi:limonene-1,2-epoxide hydrolase